MTAPASRAGAQRRFERRLDRRFGVYLLAFVLFVLAMAAFERLGLSRRLIGVSFLLATILVYAAIGMACRTADPVEYYVAGRRVPAMYNGMATGADWMSAASFIGLAGMVYLGGYGGLGMVGTPQMIADQMEEWLIGEACDGFNVMFPYLPGGLDDFVDKVVPELQRRGLFRREYEGRTLRENLGLPRPDNRFFAATAKAAE